MPAIRAPRDTQQSAATRPQRRLRASDRAVRGDGSRRYPAMTTVTDNQATHVANRS